MPTIKLTKSSIGKEAKPDASEKPKEILYFDTEVKGFGLRVTPAGKRVFIVQGRVMGSQNSIQFSIGNFGTFTVEQAREEAREHLRAMRKGIDPRAAKKADQSARVAALHRLRQAVLVGGRDSPAPVRWRRWMPGARWSALGTENRPGGQTPGSSWRVLGETPSRGHSGSVPSLKTNCRSQSGLMHRNA